MAKAVPSSKPARDQVPPKVGEEVFADSAKAAKAKPATPPKVGPEVFGKPVAIDDKPIKKPVGPEVFSAEQLEGIVPEPILSPGQEKEKAPTAKGAGDVKANARATKGAGDTKTTAKASAAKAPAKATAKAAPATTPATTAAAPVTGAGDTKTNVVKSDVKK